MHSIKQTHKPAWILAFTTGLLWIPYAIITSTTDYSYDNKNLTIREGVFVKRQRIIPLYRIIDVQARRNILGYGTVTVLDKTSSAKLRLVAKPLETARALQIAREHAQNQQSTIHTEIF